MPEQKILAVRLSGDEMHARIFKATVYEIFRLAAERLSQLARRLAHPLAPPIPIDLLAEQILGLDFLWEDIDELPRETVLGALHPHKRLIIMNEKHRTLFDTKL